RRGAAALAEDAALAAEADDVPHDQEVAGELEPRDEPELVLELAADGRRHDPVALARARVGERAQVAIRRLAVRQRQLGEAVAQVGERELAALGDAPAPAQRGRAGAAGARRCSAALARSPRPARSSVVPSRMQVRTSRSARPVGAAWRTSPVATTGTRAASARSERRRASRSPARSRWRWTSTA